MGKKMKRLLSCLLVLSMVFAAVPWMPQERAYAYDSAFRYYEAGDWVKFLAPFYLTHLPADWHDYQFEEKGDSSFDYDTYVKLTKDISYEVGKVEHNNGATWAVVLGDIVSAGLMEILWDKIDQKRPRYIDDKGNTVWTAGDVENFLRAGTYGVTKVLDLNGHDFVLKYPNMNCHSATLFDVSHCDLYITDSVGGGSIKLDGYITAPDDYNYFKEKAGDDQQRDIFYVHDGGRLFINGGLIEAGRSKTEAGFTIFNADVRSSSDHYTGSATRYVNGTAIRIGDGGEVVINGGTVEGRGYEHISDSGKYADRPNAVIEMTGGKLTINGGTINAKGGANILSIDGNAEVNINAGRFNLHKNDNLFCGLAYGSDNWYEIETNTVYGTYGFNKTMFPDAGHTTVKYGSKKTTANDIETAIKANPTSMEVYPAGGMYNMKVENAEKDKDHVPYLDPTVADHMIFTLDCVDRDGNHYTGVNGAGAWHGEFGDFFGYTDRDGNFTRWNLYPDDLPWPTGQHPARTLTSSDIFYKVELYDANAELIKFKRNGETVSSSTISGNTGYENPPRCVVNLADTTSFGDLLTRLKDGELYHLIVTMTEKFYGPTDTWTVESAAGRAFYIQEKQTPPVVTQQPGAGRLDNAYIVNAQGQTVNGIVAKATDATDAWWVVTDKKTGSGTRMEGTVSYSDDGVCTASLTMEVNAAKTVKCVFRNAAGTTFSNEAIVDYRVQFLKTENETVTLFKGYPLTLSQPIDHQSFSKVEWRKVDRNLVFDTTNTTGTNYKIGKYSRAADATNYIGGPWICIVTQPGVGATVQSRQITVKWSSEDLEQYITTANINANGLFDDLCIGDLVPTDPSQLYCDDPRIVIQSIDWTGGTRTESGKTYIASPNPSYEIVLGIPSGSSFRYRPAADGQDYFTYTLDGKQRSVYVKDFAGLPSFGGPQSIKLSYTYDTHTALETPLDSLTYTPEEIRVQTGTAVDKTIDFTWETNSRFLNAGQAAHMITGVEPYTGQNALPAGLSLTKVDADTYRISGTVSDTLGTHTTLLKVTSSTGDSSNGSRDAVLRFHVVPGAEDAEAGLSAMQESQHRYHNWGDWIDNEDGTHSHYCSQDGCTAAETAEHVWNDGEIKMAATPDSDGVKLYTCVCSATKEVEYSYETVAYTLTFHMNDGSDAFGHIEAHEGDEISIPAMSDSYKSAKGGSFKYWTASASGSGTRYAAGDKLTVTGDMEFYAQWTRTKKHTLKKSAAESSDVTVDQELRTVSVEGDQTPKAPVLVSSYDENGRFVGLDAATGSEEEFSIAKSAVELMLFWVNEQYAPVCESVEVKLNE